MLKDTEEVKTKKKKRNIKYASSDSNTDEDDVEQLEAFLARRFTKEKENSKVSFLLFFSIVMN